MFREIKKKNPDNKYKLHVRERNFYEKMEFLFKRVLFIYLFFYTLYLL